MKHAAAAAARLGLPWYGPGQRLHISGEHSFVRSLGASFAHCAFFSGTAGPHRKLVVQLMDRAGAIHGYAKVSRMLAVHSLLANEATALREMRATGFRSASIPEVLLHRERNRTAMLVTAPIGSATGQTRRLTRMHLDFLDELAGRTASRRPGAQVFPDGGAAKLEELSPNLSPDWRGRLQRQLDFLGTRKELVAPAGLAHGDFTPGNVFPGGGRLCVIDWEYAGYDYPADYDLIHFLFSLASLAGSPPIARCNGVHRYLADKLGRTPAQAHARLIAYLCARTFFLAGRRLRNAGLTLHWEGERELALMLDDLSHSKSPSAIRFDQPAGER